MVNLNESLVGKPKSKRIFYFDALRALAIISVITIHVFASTFYLTSNNAHFHSLSWFVNDIFGVCFRIGVVLFLMLAGALSLGRDWNIKSFLGRRIPRIIIPFAFWGFIFATGLTLLFWLAPNILTPHIYNSLSDLTTVSIFTYLNFLYSYYMADAFTSTSYWFFWMILGTYLIMPIFNKWVYNSDLRELEYFLFFWLITCIFDYTLGFPFPIKLTYFVSPIGLVVLGYYLRFTDRKILNNPYFDLFLVISSVVVELALSYLFSTPGNYYYFDRYSIFMAVQVIGVFLLFKNCGKFNIHINFLENPDGLFRKSVFSIAKCSYGMYLVQRPVIYFLLEFIRYDFFMVHETLSLILLLVFSVLVSWGIISLLSFIPNMSKIVGAK